MKKFQRCGVFFAGVFCLFFLSEVKANLVNPLMRAANEALKETVAEALPVGDFSPYADLSLDVHWDQDAQDLVPLDLSALSEAQGVQSYHLAFITDAGACLPGWGGQASYDIHKAWGKSMLTRLSQAHVNYIISFGGASGRDLSMTCNASQLADVYLETVQTYEPQGLDFDIENGTANVSRIMSALQIVQSQYPTLKISFTLPVMPQGLTIDGNDVIAKAKASGLKFHVNVMAMDYGTDFRGDMGQYAIQAAESVFGTLQGLYPETPAAELWGMIEVTPMIGVIDVNVEQFTLQNVDTLRDFAKQQGLGGLSMWDVNRDYPCADQSTNTILTEAMNASKKN